MTIDEVIEKHTHREYITWMDFFDEELNNPDRSDYYMMKLTRTVEHIMSSKLLPPLEDYKIPFKTAFSKENDAQRRKREQQFMNSWTMFLSPMAQKPAPKVPIRGR